MGSPVGRSLGSQLDVDEEIDAIFALDGAPPREVPEKFTDCPDGRPADVASVLRGANVKLAAYLAADACGGPPAEDGADAFDLGRFLEIAAAAEVEAVVVASGPFVYGAHAGSEPLLPFTEGAAIRAKGFAPAKGDLTRESAVAAFARAHPGIAVALARLAPTVGPGTVGPAARFLGGKRVVGLLAFEPMLQFLHLDDAALAVFKLLKSRKTGIYNVAPDDSLNLFSVARALGKTVKRYSPRIARAYAGAGRVLGLAGPAGLGPGLLPLLMYSVVLSNRKIKRALGYAFKYACAGAIADHASGGRG